VSFSAAVILYVLTSAAVRGFAFTLGLTTLINLLLVTLFTHPLVQLLARNKFFASGHRFSGFDLSAQEASYKGRGEFRFSPAVPETKLKKSSKQAEIRQTIAERKALQGKESNE
jgi:preprotein translocase subunit SecD